MYMCLLKKTTDLYHQCVAFLFVRGIYDVHTFVLCNNYNYGISKINDFHDNVER